MKSPISRLTVQAARPQAAPTQWECGLCNGTTARAVCSAYDRRYARSQSFTYVRCNACGLIAMAPAPTAQDMAAAYPADYHARIAPVERNLDKCVNRFAVRYYYGVDRPRRARLRRALCRSLSGRILRGVLEPYGHNRLLDVGCGAGAALAVYRRLGWCVQGVEPDARAVAAGRQRGLPIHEGTIFTAPCTPEFDVVLVSHVIEHVTDPVRFLRRAAAFLAPGGKLVVTTPNSDSLSFWLYGSCWDALEAPRHLFLFNPATLRRVAAAADLFPRRLHTRAEPQIWRRSWHYLRRQGPVQPEGLPAREAVISTAEAAGHWVRDLMTPFALCAAAAGRGDIIEAELIRR